MPNVEEKIRLNKPEQTNIPDSRSRTMNVPRLYLSNDNTVKIWAIFELCFGLHQR